MKQKQTGMTLIEILIVVLVVSVGMAATAKFQGELLQSGATTKSRIEGLAYIQAELETLRMTHASATAGSDDERAGSNAAFDIDWQVKAVNGLANTSEYVASATWSDRQERSQSLQLSSFLYADLMLGGAGGSDAVRASTAACVFQGYGCFPVEPPLPRVQSEVDIDQEKEITDISQVGVLDKEGLEEVSPGNLELGIFGSEIYIERLESNFTYASIYGRNLIYIDDDISNTLRIILLFGRFDDKVYITGGISSSGEALIRTRNGDDTLHIAGDVSGTIDVEMGDDSDYLYLGGSIGDEATFAGFGQSLFGRRQDSGVDTVCLASYSASDWDAVKDSFSDFEIILFNDGYRFENGFSDESYPIPQGCGSSAEYRYSYPINLKVDFDDDGQATTARLINYYPDSGVGGDTVINSGADSWLQIDLDNTDPSDSDLVLVTFDLYTVNRINLRDAVLVCPAWGGGSDPELQIKLWDATQKASCEE